MVWHSLAAVLSGLVRLEFPGTECLWDKLEFPDRSSLNSSLILLSDPGNSPPKLSLLAVVTSDWTANTILCSNDSPYPQVERARDHQAGQH